MAKTNPLDLRPEELVNRVDPAELIKPLKAARALTGSQRAALDYALSYWVMQVVERHGDLDGALLMDKLCALAMRLDKDEPAAAQFHSRLSAWRDLLENKRLSINARGSGRAERLLQTPAVLQALENGELPQSALRERLGLSPGRVSQLLSVMEEGGLIQRVRRGKENFVRLPTQASPRRAQARRAEQAHPAQNNAGQTETRPMGVLRWPRPIAA